MRTAVTTILIAIILLACGASARQHTISAALTATDAARDGFIAFDARHQAELVRTAASLDDGRQRLDAYRKQRDPVVQAFAATYRLIAAAALANNAKSVVDMVNAAKLLHAGLAEIGAAP